MGGPGHLLLDLTDSTRSLSESDRNRLVASLPTLPCVTVAIVAADASDDTDRGEKTGESRADFELRSLASICDVRVSEEGEIDRLLGGFERTPLSALAFVQLLRSASTTSIYSGLVAESFVYSTLQAGPEFARWQSSRGKKRRQPEETSPPCRIERDRGRLEIYLSRPDKHNAFSRAMRDSLCEALQLALADPSIEEILLRGEGDSFCSGGDLDEFGSMPDPAQAHAIRTTRSPAHLLSQVRDRVRCEVHGACVGAGVELPAFSGHVAADEDAFFALPEIALGLIPGAGGTVSLPRRIGRQRTAWLGLSGERIDARTALDWGLIDEVRLQQHADDRSPEPH